MLNKVCVETDKVFLVSQLIKNCHFAILNIVLRKKMVFPQNKNKNVCLAMKSKTLIISSGFVLKLYFLN